MYSERPLFGGAISCDIPSAWRDVSDVRQVPDHQECWQEIDGAVLVVEILERQEVGDHSAASFFFADLAESNGISDIAREAPFKSYTASQATERIQNATKCLGVGYQKIAVGRDYDIAGNPRQNQEVRWVLIELCVIRLPSVSTDLLVTLSKPLPNPNEPPSEGTDHEWSEAFRRILSSFQIRDWELFG